MDRSYKTDIPACVRGLERLKEEFAALETGTDWTRLRILPLLEHARSLDRALHAPEFARERSRLRKGVEMFHADLVYLRTNIRGLKKILARERRTPPGMRRALP